MSPTILGGITKHFKANQLLLAGAVLFGVGNLLSGYVVNIAMLMLVYGVMTGVGTGLIYPTNAALYASLMSCMSMIGRILWGWVL